MDTTQHHHPSGPQSVTLRMVAEASGVSVITVSRVMRNEPHVAPETAAHVRRVAARLGYNPASNQIARRMVMRRHGIAPLNRLICLFFPPLFYHGVEGPYYLPIYHSIMTSAMYARFAVMTNYLHYPPSEAHPQRPTPFIEEVPTVFRHGDVDGVLLLAGPSAQAQVARMLRREPGFGARPVVTMIEPAPGCSSVLPEEAPAAYAAMRHLLDLGHRRVMHFIPDEDEWSCRRSRLVAYRQAVRDYGEDPARVLLHVPSDWKNPQVSVTQALSVLRQHPEITAILANNDDQALRLHEALTSAGLRVPEDLSLIGHDDTAGNRDDYGRSFLTTVSMPLAEIGAAAARILLQQIETGSVREERLLLPTTFLPRASTGPPRASR